MAQLIKQADIFGRLGTGVGKGLAEQVPKEIERNRLSAGLQQLERDAPGLNPQQYYTRALQVPGLIDRPQAVQSLAELARLQNQRDAYMRSGGMEPQSQGPAAAPGIPQNPGAKIRDMEFANLSQRKGPVPANEQTPPVRANESGQPQIVQDNPLDEKYQPKVRWTPQQRDQRVSHYINQGFTPDQSKQLASDDESRFLGTADDYQKQLDAQKAVDVEAKQKMRNQLKTKLGLIEGSASDEALLGKLSGESLSNLERGMNRDIRSKGDTSLDDVVNDWTNRGLNMSKAKTKLDNLIKTTGIEEFSKNNQAYNKLKEYQKVFQKADNLEEYYNILRSQAGMSSQTAAAIAFPPNERIHSYISKFKPTSMRSGRFGPVPNADGALKDAQRAAIEIGNDLSYDDSLLSIAKYMREKDPMFNQRAFFKQLSEDQDRLRLNDRQRLELAEGENSDLVPTWSDILWLPLKGLLK